MESVDGHSDVSGDLQIQPSGVVEHRQEDENSLRIDSLYDGMTDTIHPQPNELVNTLKERCEGIQERILQQRDMVVSTMNEQKSIFSMISEQMTVMQVEIDKHVNFLQDEKTYFSNQLQHIDELISSAYKDKELTMPPTKRSRIQDPLSSTTVLQVASTLPSIPSCTETMNQTISPVRESNISTKCRPTNPAKPSTLLHQEVVNLIHLSPASSVTLRQPSTKIPTYASNLPSWKIDRCGPLSSISNQGRSVRTFADGWNVVVGSYPVESFAVQIILPSTSLLHVVAIGLTREPNFWKIPSLNPQRSFPYHKTGWFINVAKGTLSSLDGQDEVPCTGSFKSGDVLTVIFNSNVRSIQLQRNGKALGDAPSFQNVDENYLYPALVSYDGGIEVEFMVDKTSS